jgi:ATP-binding protein involved in chromosome partitioning
MKAGGGKKIAEDLAIPFLGKIPIDPQICSDSYKGSPFTIEHPDSPASKAFMEIVKKVEEFLKQRKKLETPDILETTGKGVHK